MALPVLIVSLSDTELMEKLLTFVEFSKQSRNIPGIPACNPYRESHQHWMLQAHQLDFNKHYLNLKEWMGEVGVARQKDLNAAGIRRDPRRYG